MKIMANKRRPVRASNVYADSGEHGFTVGDLASVTLSSTKATIFELDEVGDAQVVFDGYLDLAIKTYPDLAKCVITYLQSDDINKLSIDIKDAQFEYTPVNSSTRRRPVTAAADLSDNKIIVQSKAVVEVYEDDWEQGEGKYVNGWEFDISGEYNSIDAVISQISNTVFAFSDNKADYYFMDGALRTSATVNNDNETPSEAEMERWMQGQEMMYTAYLYLYLGVGSIHEMTDEEAEAYGITVE